MKPGLVDGKLTATGRLVMTRITQGMLLGTLPTQPQAQQQALNATLVQLESILACQSSAAVNELSDLLSLMASSAGRRWLVGLTTPWEDATAEQCASALQSMRESGVALRVQALQGLHDAVCFPYFCDEASWTSMGYPGPRMV